MRRALLGTLTVATLLAGCGDPSPPSFEAKDTASPAVDEIAEHGGRVCPARLPGTEDNHGFGPDSLATSSPVLPPIDRAWVCAYQPTEIGRSDEGVVYQWQREGGEYAVPADALPGLHATLGELALPAADGEISCTADLGQRHLVVYASGTDLTGVAVDQFGCDDVRLTDDPFETEPGTSTHPGIVPGVLRAPAGLTQFLRDLLEAPTPHSTDPGGDVPALVEDPAAPVPEALERLATEFVRYAMGEVDTFPHADSVRFKLGGQDVKWIDDIVATLVNRRIWRICPSGWEVYAAGGCPIDVLGPIREAAANERPMVYSSKYEEILCAPPLVGPPPSGRIVVLRPEPEMRTCASNFALVLHADERGRLETIDLTLAEP